MQRFSFWQLPKHEILWKKDPAIGLLGEEHYIICCVENCCGIFPLSHLIPTGKFSYSELEAPVKSLFQPCLKTTSFLTAPTSHNVTSVYCRSTFCYCIITITINYLNLRWSILLVLIWAVRPHISKCRFLMICKRGRTAIQLCAQQVIDKIIAWYKNISVFKL